MMSTSTPTLWSSSDEEDEYEDEMTMILAVIGDAQHAKEHVLNLKGKIKGHRVMNPNRARGI